MSLLLTSRPDRALKTDGTKISRWLSAHQPVTFKAQRRDFFATSIYNSGGFAAFATPVNAEIEEGGRIYLFGNSGTYDTFGTITGIAMAGLFLIVTTDIPANLSVPVAAGWFNYLERENYYAEMAVTVTDSNTGADKTFTNRATPNAKGAIEFDASAVLPVFIRKQIAHDYFAGTFVNKRDGFAFSSFKFSTLEKWVGSENTAVVDTLTYYAVDGVRQLLDTYGQNFADFVPFAQDITEKARFLTEFERPAYFVGYPFCLGFIFTDEVAGYEMTREEEKYSDPATQVGATSANIDPSQGGGVNILRLAGGYSDEVELVDVFLKLGSVAVISYFESGYHDDGYFETVPSVPPPVVTPYRVTEKKRVRIVRACNDSGVFVRWRNRFGAWEHWLFTGKTVEENQLKSGTKTGERPGDLASQTYRDRVTLMLENRRLTLSDFVDSSDWKGLASIYSSPEIQILQDLENWKWLSVQVSPENYKRRAEATSGDFRVIVDLPDLFNVPN